MNENQNNQQGTQSNNSEEKNQDLSLKQQEAQTNNQTKPIWKQTWFWALIALIGIIAIIILVTINLKSNNNTQNKENQKVVAKVNGEKITQNELNVRLAQVKQATPSSGQTNDKQLQQQALNSLIGQTLILQEANKQNISIDDKKIDQSYQQTIDSFKSQKEFKKQLSNNHLTKETLKQNIEEQLLMQKYLSENINATQINITDKEIQQTYDQLKSQQSDIDSLDKVKPRIKQYLQSQKRSQLIQQLINKLKQTANIQTML